jgi:hypothetical protein
VSCVSLTLRDAQHLCWKTFRKLELVNQSSTPSKAEENLVAKAKEIALKSQNSENGLSKEAAAKLLSELLYFAFVLAEQRGVELEESFLQTIDELILGSVM